MSRSIPSESQLIRLMRFMESKSWLLNGHARTSTARKRTRQAWVDISAVLNKDDSGCKKTAEQWSKYWKDKKASVRRKVNKIGAFRKSISEGIEELYELSEVEQKMLALMDGENTVLENENQTDPFLDDQVSDDAMEQSNADDEDDDVKPSSVLLVSSRRQSEENKANNSESESGERLASRCAAPSESQLSRLVNFMESRPWLHGHARTSRARKRTRQAWMEIGAVLNEDDTGCKKTAEQWSKYWKDKKGSMKRKVNKIAAARKIVSGGNEELYELSEVEHKILALMGGENAVLGSHNQKDPFHDDQVSDDEMEKSNADDEDDDVKPSNILLTHTIVIPSTSETVPIEKTRRLSHIEEKTVSGRRQSEQKKAIDCESSSEASHTEDLKKESLSGRRPTPRRLLQTSSSLRRARRSELTVLTERFLAIEEKRAEAELITAHSRKNYARGQQTMAQAIDRLAGAINIYATGVNKLLEHVLNK